MIRGSAAASQNDFLRFTVENSSTATAMSAPNPLEAIRDYMRLLELETRQPGWDGERGRPVDAQAWRRADVFVKTCFERIDPLPMPDVSASGDGYVHLVWFSNDRRAVVEIGDKRTHWTLLSRERPIVEEDVEVRDLIERLRLFLRGE